ncbi:MAG: hypothetical protein LBT74_03455 [Acidobacteriota bacterium]|jgi:hypothetical protein|nr:hypothetical protein [Acidobacteriota bacterium]
MPNRDTPTKLVEAWLEFHSEGLCRELDAVFAFDGAGMEVWCRSEENRSYRKLQRLLQPLQSAYGVELYATIPPGPEKLDDGRADDRGDLPPSLLENRELRAHLRPLPGLNMTQPRIFEEVVINGVRYVRELVISSSLGGALSPAQAERVLRARLFAYARSVLEDGRIMRQYAEDLCELVQTALEPAFDAALRRRAALVCRGHAKDLAKSVEDLRKDLSYAFPKPKEGGGKPSGGGASPRPSSPPEYVAKTAGIAVKARELSSRVYSFVYPTEHTVSLDELRRPGLVDALEAFEAEARDFAKGIATFSP